MVLRIGLIGGGGIATHHIRGYRSTNEARIVQVAEAKS